MRIEASYLLKGLSVLLSEEQGRRSPATRGGGVFVCRVSRRDCYARFEDIFKSLQTYSGSGLISVCSFFVFLIYTRLSRAELLSGCFRALFVCLFVCLLFIIILGLIEDC